MVTEYQNRILKMAEVEFNNIEDTDILTFDHFDQGYGIKGWYYLYYPDGRLKDLKCGLAVPLSERKFTRPMLKKSFEFLEYEEKKEKEHRETIKIEKERKEKKLLKQNNIKIKRKRNISPEEREKRRQRMAKTIKAYWMKKKGLTEVDNNNASIASSSNVDSTPLLE